ncbi:MAG: ATP-binding protein [Coriobacteriales bacterium]|nr:ATP-binding protein [Coriobacteriales bacterium]
MKNYEDNPFNPQFGKRPEQFIGRELLINDFLQSLATKNDPNRTTIITGIRGTGKTAILSDVHASLDTDRFAVIDVTAQDGMLLEILDGFIRNNKGKNWLGKRFDKMQGFSVGALGFSLGLTKRDDTAVHSFRFMLSDLLDELRAKDIKVVFLVDEVHNGTPEMREFAVSYQHLVREEYDVALLMAGLPSSVNDVLNDQVLTFLRRAHRVELENINVKAVEIAYEQAFAQVDRSFSGDSLRKAAAATKGYPYLIQLLGFYLFTSEKQTVSSRLVQQSLELAKIELFKNVHDLLYRDLSAKDREFLFAMTKDGAQSSFSSIKERLGVSPGYASKYRERLLMAGMIKAVAHGTLAFAPPYMREYLIAKEG